MDSIFLLIVSTLSAYGIAVSFVQKGDEWPVKLVVDPLKFILSKVNAKAPKVFDCILCTSFWTTLVTDLVLMAYTHHYFFWPLSGFITLGLAWTILEFFNVLDSRKEEGLDEALGIEEPLNKYPKDIHFFDAEQMPSTPNAVLNAVLKKELPLNSGNPI